MLVFTLLEVCTLKSHHKMLYALCSICLYRTYRKIEPKKLVCIHNSKKYYVLFLYLNIFGKISRYNLYCWNNKELTRLDKLLMNDYFISKENIYVLPQTS